MKLEELQPDCAVRGIQGEEHVTVLAVKWHGTDALTLVYRSISHELGEQILYRADEERLEIVPQDRSWNFDGDGASFRLVLEAQRIHLAHLFDPMLAVHTSMLEPLPHQITAVYDSMLSKQPLRFLLADDPGAGKTIMAGLLIKELIARGDLKRCLIVCPGSLVEQWQDELSQRFALEFEILTKDKLESARSGNWFFENDLMIARLDKLARDEEAQKKVSARDCRFDLVICDEAHKMSASFYGRKVNYTKRYRLGQLLSTLTRHFLLMTATPHNGKEEDFQLFLALLDSDRFEGRFRDGAHRVDVSDMMRRMVKEKLLKFDGKPLFPERIASSVSYNLTDTEAELYQAVTHYVRKEFNRAEALQNNKRAGTVGFALTVLQRRLASSPEAIFQSLIRRRKRLEYRLQDVTLRKGEFLTNPLKDFDFDFIEELEDAPDEEIEEMENLVIDEATAASTIVELQSEIDSLKSLEHLAADIRKSGHDAKWLELKQLLEEIFLDNIYPDNQSNKRNSRDETILGDSVRRKLVIFTEHRDTLTYLAGRISTLLGQPELIMQIHGGMGREQRLHAQESFLHDPRVQILLATDAAGEGINLQRAHLMINYDLPWNPNRLEQRFGRIHRIGQTEVCHLWNLVAGETREGDVYKRLLEKLDQARASLGGQVFDVLGKIQFDGRSLRSLLIEAVRYGDRPEVRAKLEQAVKQAVDRRKLKKMLEKNALVQDAMDSSEIVQARFDLERANARKLQPNYIESFFLEAFKRLGGTVREREKRRYQISNVPEDLRNFVQESGIRGHVLRRYERIAFDKEMLSPSGQAQAAFICPGHALLSSVIGLTLIRHGELMRRGTVLVDDTDSSHNTRILFAVEHALQDGAQVNDGSRRIVSQRMLYVEMDAAGNSRHLHNAPYLDYRPLHENEPSARNILSQPELNWITHRLEDEARRETVEKIVPEHFREVRERRQQVITKTRGAVHDRLHKEIAYWHNRAVKLRTQERKNKAKGQLNSSEAMRRAKDLEYRLQQRMDQLQTEEQLFILPPKVLGGAVIVPRALIDKLTGVTSTRPTATQESAARARQVVMDVEKSLGYVPTDYEFEKRGYDIESQNPKTGKLRLIEVKGRVSGANTITVTKNEILTALNAPEEYILAIVEFLDTEKHRVHYIQKPFKQDPDWNAVSVNYSMDDLIERAKDPE